MWCAEHVAKKSDSSVGKMMWRVLGWQGCDPTPAGASSYAAQGRTRSVLATALFIRHTSHLRHSSHLRTHSILFHPMPFHLISPYSNDALPIDSYSTLTGSGHGAFRTIGASSIARLRPYTTTNAQSAMPRLSRATSRKSKLLS